jgi:hypothetical protein
MQDWDSYLKVLTNEIEMKNPENEEEDQRNGTGDAKKKLPKTRDKRKELNKGTTISAWNKMKSHNELAIYTFTNNDINKIDYQVRDFIEEEPKQLFQK